MEIEARLKPHGDHASVTRAARWAEDLGFKTFFASEASYDPFLPLVTAAMATSRIEIGTGIAVAHQHRIVQVLIKEEVRHVFDVG